MDWKEELQKILSKGRTDSDIEDFVDEHPEINAREIWDYTYDFIAPESCKGCKYVAMNGTYPCIRCLRHAEKDFYEKRQKGEICMKMKMIEFQRIVSYLMENLVEDTERDYDTKEQILCEELVNSFDVEFED